MTNTLRFFTILFLIALTSCQSTVNEIPPTPMPTQAFLPDVIPEPGEEISYRAYKASFEVDDELGIYQDGPICVTYDAYYIIEIGDEGLTWEDYLSRSLLLVNGEVWPNSGKPDHARDALGSVGINGGKANAVGPFNFCWNIELEPGMHTIEFKTKKTSGEELAYRWSFLITE
jgi:hypothetical protein